MQLNNSIRFYIFSLFYIDVFQAELIVVFCFRRMSKRDLRARKNKARMAKSVVKFYIIEYNQ